MEARLLRNSCDFIARARLAFTPWAAIAVVDMCDMLHFQVVEIYLVQAGFRGRAGSLWDMITGLALGYR